MLLQVVLPTFKLMNQPSYFLLGLLDCYVVHLDVRLKTAAQDAVLANDSRRCQRSHTDEVFSSKEAEGRWAASLEKGQAALWLPWTQS